MASTTFKIEGAVNVQVTITENSEGGLDFHVAVLDETGSIGDLNGLFFDIADDTLTDGLAVSGADVTDEKFDANSVSKLSGGTNVNGEIVKEYDKFDGGVKFGTDGMAKDDIRETSFTLSHDSVDLTLDMMLSQDFAVRLTSVGEEDGARNGSLKLGTTSPETPDPEGPGPSDAVDDFMFVNASNGVGLDLLDTGDSSVLANDPGAVSVVSVDGVAVDLINGATVTGSNGGLITIFADGSIDFNGNGDFGAFPLDETTVSYTTDAGDTATVFITVDSFEF